MHRAPSPEAYSGFLPNLAYDLAFLKALNLSSLDSLVIDEADLILSYGHDQDMRSVLSAENAYLPTVFQSFLMSATMTKDVEALKGLVLRNPAILSLEEDEDEARNLVQYAARYDISKPPPACSIGQLPSAWVCRNMERVLHRCATLVRPSRHLSTSVLHTRGHLCLLLAAGSKQPSDIDAYRDISNRSLHFHNVIKPSLWLSICVVNLWASLPPWRQRVPLGN